MLNNEQRAHDIAVAMLPYIIEVVKANNNDCKINIVDEYLKAYNAYLADLNNKTEN